MAFSQYVDCIVLPTLTAKADVGLAALLACRTLSAGQEETLERSLAWRAFQKSLIGNFPGHFPIFRAELCSCISFTYQIYQRSRCPALDPYKFLSVLLSFVFATGIIDKFGFFIIFIESSVLFKSILKTWVT